ncbi:response regulator transcription factor [Streptomyces sp. NPDC005438]|uniref:response regulator transcription factor n=1 Tax=Streptomyces sp. NPDC005438 TaxID=3156880 RepID=UPI0033BA9CCB
MNGERDQSGDGERLRLLVADDERLVRTALRALLGAEEDLEVVGEATTGAEALGLARSLCPDVVLMDVRMPGVDGIQATRQLLATMGERAPRVLVVTTFENDSFVYEALRAGAQGFVLKRATPEELLRAVRVVARGDSLLFPSAVRELAARHARRDRGRALRERLTAREAEVLRLMARGLTNGEIARELSVGPATVKSHVGALLGKLGARDRTQAVIAAYEQGFVTPG